MALIGETGKKLHSGRSRNEQIATDLRLFVRDSMDNLRCAAGRSAGSPAGPRHRNEVNGHARLYAFAAGGASADVALAAGLF